MTTTPRQVGRARSIPRQRQGVSARDEILEAAAGLFSEHGYAATSTRSIALAVGIKQASLYYHFANKEDILAGLLEGTVQPSLSFATRLGRSGQPPQVQLYALTRFDVELLLSGRWNVGALYQLPEVRADRFTGFRRERGRLREAYGRRIVAGIRDHNLYRFPAREQGSGDMDFAHNRVVHCFGCIVHEICQRSFKPFGISHRIRQVCG